MATEETKEQQQIYNIFRSCIYIVLIFEIVMNLPLVANDPIAKFLLSFLYKLKLFNSVIGCKFMELVCIGVTCIGTKARKELKFNMKTMVIYPLTIGFYLLPNQSNHLCHLFCPWYHARPSRA